MRHDVACSIVWRQPPTRPAVSPAVPYVERRQGNEPSNAHGQRIPGPHGPCQNREGKAQLPARRRYGARVDGMVSICEVSINVVKPGTSQTCCQARTKMVSGRVQGFTPPLSWTRNSLGGKRRPNPIRSNTRNVVSPYRSSLEVGTPQGEPTAMRVWEVGASECRLVIGWIRGSTFPDAQAGRLPTGLD